MNKKIDKTQNDVDIEYHSDMKVASKAPYVNGKKHGQECWWHENGSKLYEIMWKEGIRHGVIAEWHENGSKCWQAMLRHNEKQGVHTTWYESGGKRQESAWADNKEFGISTEWYEDGRKAKEICIIPGEECAHIEWDEKGNVSKVEFSTILLSTKSNAKSKNHIKGRLS